jgi:hypothetical protein
MDKKIRSLRSNSTPVIKDFSRNGASPSSGALASSNSERKGQHLTLDDIRKIIREENQEAARTIREEMHAIRSDIRHVLDRLQDLETNFNTVKDIQQRHESEIQRLSEEMQMNQDSHLKHTVNEIENRLARQTSLVIRGLPEHNSGSLSENQTADKERFIEICSMLRVPESINYELKRVGTIRSDRPRLLKVTLDRKAVRDDILPRSKMLRNTKFKDVYINKDLTITQQRERQALLSELRARRQRNEDVVIRRDKVVPRNEAYLPQNFHQRF